MLRSQKATIAVRSILFLISSSLLTFSQALSAATIDNSTNNGLFYLNSIPAANRDVVSSIQVLNYIDNQPHGLSSKTYQVIGGVLFKGTYAPGPWLNETQKQDAPDFTTIRYDPSLPDGQRLTLGFENKTIVVPIADWLLLPIIHYADSDFNALVTLFGQYDLPEDKQDQLADVASDVCHCLHPYLVALHPAFLNTAAGMLLLYSDILPIDERFRTPPKIAGKEIGSWTFKFDESQSAAAYREISNIIGNSPFDSYIDSDPDVIYRSNITPDALVSIFGHASYLFWHSGDNQNDIILNQKTNMRLQERRDLFMMANPPVYLTIDAVARWSAVFRYMKQHNPDGWHAFFSTLENVQIPRDVETPIIYGQFSVGTP